ncbi:hypothetical protein [Pseudemcibacter aquimaris]|uniref:hypothetical protein n=1 Tax=Pseudemcibacter aquimaris TaxID=2857064 RepID=UPI0020129EB2|nr:hypothetical protein [Pseudemcibacter aquimaris]MCC3861381.1 hypothetical protein [Pseudemcibacter aquimaris]WDU58151.1 hypothetical protein KW060_13235 [Pseudemcibacter aquimaris]
MNIKNIFSIIAVLFALTACEKAGLVIKNGPAGPNTGDLIDPLPDDLVADKNNARHGDDDLKPVIN